jgi:hypothetical protein
MDNKDKKIEGLENELNIERQKVSKLLDTNITLMMSRMIGGNEWENWPLTPTQVMYTFMCLNSAVISILQLYHGGSVEIPTRLLEETREESHLGAIPYIDKENPHIVTLKVVDILKEYEDAQEYEEEGE